MKRLVLSCTNARLVLTLSVFLLSLVPTESSAIYIQFVFDRLPSQQMWSYKGTVPESEVFSVSNGTLKIDGRGLGDTMARCYKNDVIHPTQDFYLKTSLRIIDSENLAGDDVSHNVFEIYIHGQNFWVNLFWSTAPGLGQSSIGISERYYQDTAVARSIHTLVNDTDFHEYIVRGRPGGRFSASIDGVVWAEGFIADLPFVGGNDILFQDGSRESEPFMEMRQFVFSQSPWVQVPEPATIILFFTGLAGVVAEKCKRNRIRRI